MGLEALKFLERTEKGIGVIEPDHEADRDLAVLEVIEEGAAIGRGIERPADGMEDMAGTMLRRLDLP